MSSAIKKHRVRIARATWASKVPDSIQTSYARVADQRITPRTYSPHQRPISCTRRPPQLPASGIQSPYIHRASGLLQIAVSTPLRTDYPVLAQFRARSAIDTALVIMHALRRNHPACNLNSCLPAKPREKQLRDSKLSLFAEVAAIESNSE